MALRSTAIVFDLLNYDIGISAGGVVKYRQEEISMLTAGASIPIEEVRLEMLACIISSANYELVCVASHRFYGRSMGSMRAA